MIHIKCPNCGAEDFKETTIFHDDGYECLECEELFTEPDEWSDDPADHKCEPEDDPKHTDNQ